MFTDPLAFPHAKALVDGLDPALAARGLAGLDVARVMPGAQTPFEYMDSLTGTGGFGWARVSRLFPSRTFPIQDSSRPAGNAPILLAQEFEVGIVRLVPFGEGGEPAEPDVQEEISAALLADMNTILNVLCGYFGGRDIPYVLGDYVPYGPQGAVAGGWWTVIGQTGVAG